LQVVAAVPEADLAGPLFEQYERGLYRFCLSRLRSREDAEDAVQATFVRAVRALQQGVRPDVAPAWLFTIARNVCSSRRLAGLRRARVETPRDLDGVPASALACEDERPDELIGLREALEEMPPKLQRVVLLREWQGLSYHEIGAELGVSQAAVETLLFRARRDLAKRLRGLLDLGPLLGVKALLGGATVAAVAVATVHPPSVATPSPAARGQAGVAGPAAIAVPHASALPAVTPVVRRVRRAPVVHATHAAPPVVAPTVARPQPAAPPRPAIVPRHESHPAGIVVRPSPARSPAVEPAAASTPTPAPETASPSAPVPPPPAPTASVPAAPAPVPQTVDAAEQTVSTATAPVAAAVDQTEQTVSTAAAPVVFAVAPAPAVPPPADPATLLPGG
jgi:RNA polymerase sigma factor (sigma-70 family)